MQVHLVHAHPEPQSFSSALAQMAAASLSGYGHSVTVSDLYQMQWNAVATGHDFADRIDHDYMNYALEQRHNHKSDTLSGDITAELDALFAADLLILNFPLYWFSTPAILKGWIDRVLVAGAIYGGKRIYSKGGLVGKRALVTCTLGGRADMFGDDGIHGQINDMLKHLLQGTLGYTGMTVLNPFFAYHAPYISDADRQQILSDYHERLAGIMDEKGLNMPDLSQFDSRFQMLAT